MKKLRWLILPLILLAFLGGFGATLALKGTQQVEAPKTVVEKPVEAEKAPELSVQREPQVSDVDTAELLKLTNEHRVANGLGALAVNQYLNQSALDKCNHMVANDYWAHVAPDGTEGWSFLKRYFTNWNKAGENLRYGVDSSDRVVWGWKNSPTHNAELLSNEYQYVGFGVCRGDTYQGKSLQLIVVQHFLGY